MVSMMSIKKSEYSVNHKEKTMSKKKHSYSEKGHKGFIRRKENELTNKQVATYLTESEYRGLTKLLKKHNIKRTDFIREAIRKAANELRDSEQK